VKNLVSVEANLVRFNQHNLGRHAPGMRCSWAGHGLKDGVGRARWSWLGGLGKWDVRES
jgi:hypothetical protein